MIEKVLAPSLIILSLLLAAIAGGHPGDPIEDNPASASTEVRDPFAPQLRDLGDGQPVNPLERFTVGELKVVATVAGVDPPRALIEDPSGLGFIVTPGAIVGAERRRIISIEDGRIVLDSSADANGDRQTITLVDQAKTQEQR